MKNIYLFILVVFISCDKSTTTNNSPNTTPLIFELSSTAFANDSVIPNKYSCKATNQVSIPFSWKNAPKGTLSFVLLMEDSDAIAVAGKVWNHWILYNIPSTSNAIEEGLSKDGPWPTKTLVGRNSFDEINYLGPCPPSGIAHKYTFRLFALSIDSLGLNYGAYKEEVLNAMFGSILGTATYKGKFTQ